MSDKPIVGKWAVIAYPLPCCLKHYEGPKIPFLVTKIYPIGRIVKCYFCGTYAPASMLIAEGLYNNGGTVIAAVLKRIPDPPAELTELEQIKEDIEQLVKEHQ